MKKNLTGLVFLILAMVLVGCSASTETATFVMDQGGMTSKLVYTYQGDKVLTESAETIMPYSMLGVTTKEEAQTIFEQASPSSVYEGIEGMTYSVEYGADSLTQKITVDYSKVDTTALAALPGMADNQGIENGASYSKTEEMLLAAGYTKE